MDKSTTRRDLIKLSAFAAAAGYVLGRGALGAPAGPAGMTYGVQLYMLRKQADSDLPGVFRAIRETGFNQVELYPTAYKLPAGELRRMVQEAGLGSVAGHFDYVGLESKLDYAHELGLHYYVCPMLPREQWASLDGFKQAADLFNKVGAAAKTRGMEFVFHNHCYEFKPMDGSTGFAELMTHSDPQLVKLELDVYWLTQAGQDPAAILKAQAARTVLIHMKDRDAGAPTGYDMGKDAQHFTELGKGTIAWPTLLAQARAQGIRYAFLDQDATAGPVTESMKVSYNYLRTLKA